MVKMLELSSRSNSRASSRASSRTYTGGRWGTQTNTKRNKGKTNHQCKEHFTILRFLVAIGIVNLLGNVNLLGSFRVTSGNLVFMKDTIQIYHIHVTNTNYTGTNTNNSKSSTSFLWPTTIGAITADASDKDTNPLHSSPSTTTATAPLPLFLEHASHGGWSNQIRCTQRAYLIARATGRVLVTAPVLPHWTNIGTELWLGDRFQRKDTIRSISSNFKLDFPLYKTYENQLPLGRVLDLNYTFPNVTTMEYHTFRSHYFAKDVNMTHWVMESNYTHDNTTYTYQQPELENQTAPGFGRRYRDLSKIAPQGGDKQLWTFLDTFYSQMHSSVSKDQPFLSMSLRFHHDIRQVAQTIQAKVWNNLPYASMHLRVGDGFARKADETMRIALDQNKYQLEQWITNSTTAFNGNLPSLIGLFVATDMEATEQQQFTETLQKQLQDLLSSNNITMQVLYSSSYFRYTRRLRRSLRYPDIFLDQQLAACASIAFTGSQGSSFSGLIDTIRQSPGACDI